jgi:hypothetical protein
MAERYARVIRQARGMHVSGEGNPSVATAVESAKDSEGYTLTIKPDGTFQLQAESGPDHVDAMDVLWQIQS